MVQAEKGVDHHKFNAAIAEKDKEIATLKRQMADLTRMVQQKLSQPAAVPEGFDYQTAQINQVHASAQEDTAYLQAPAQFVQDLSGSLEPPKRRGRPPGSTNKPKES
jgi:small-conductance mechanosensitive channel